MHHRVANNNSQVHGMTFGMKHLHTDVGCSIDLGASPDDLSENLTELMDTTVVELNLSSDNHVIGLNFMTTAGDILGGHDLCSTSSTNQQLKPLGGALTL